MKQREVLLEQLNSQLFFDKATLYQLGKQQEIKSSTLDSYINRSLKQKQIILLKNGLYISSDFYNQYKNDISYLFYLANILRAPSYISSWTALQYYNLTTEVIHTITSVSLKITRTYTTKISNFSYQFIQKKLFTDFSLEKTKFDFFIASPSKALFDLLYFKTRQFRQIQSEDIQPLVEELRIDIEEMPPKEQKKFYSMIKNYLTHRVIAK